MIYQVHIKSGWMEMDDIEEEDEKLSYRNIREISV